MTAMMTNAGPSARLMNAAPAAALVVRIPRAIIPTLQPKRTVDHDATVHVWTGQLEVGSGTAVLTALLGSCVGIGMLWRGRAALAHCLLPEGDAVETHAARYVSTAVPAMLAALGVRRAQYDEIEIVVAGGARMLRLSSGGDGDGAIGRRNIVAVQAQLAARGLRAAFEDLGGCHGRRLSIDCARQSYLVTRVVTEIGGRA